MRVCVQCGLRLWVCGCLRRLGAGALRLWCYGCVVPCRTVVLRGFWCPGTAVVLVLGCVDSLSGCRGASVPGRSNGLVERKPDYPTSIVHRCTFPFPTENDRSSRICLIFRPCFVRQRYLGSWVRDSLGFGWSSLQCSPTKIVVPNNFSLSHCRLVRPSRSVCLCIVTLFVGYVLLQFYGLLPISTLQF